MSEFILHRTARRTFKCNAKTWANTFTARILEPGIVSYQDQQCGNALLKKETIDRCINSFVGRPLILARDNMGKPTLKHQKVRPNSLEKLADGYISAVEYNQADGWWYAKGTVHNDEAKDAIKKVGYVSCAYDVLDTAEGGEYHNLPYNEEITAFEGEHLAIVASPRYEEATIRLNAKTKKPNTMFKWIMQKITGSGEQKQNSVETGELPVGAALEIDGAHVPVTDVVEGYKQNAKGSIDGTTELELAGGEKVSINQLIECRQKLNEKEEEEKKAKEAKDKENKKNADDEEEDKKKEKENSKPRAYKVNTTPGVISKAKESGLLVEVSNSAPDTYQSKAQRGVDRYGPIKKVN